jgi:UDP-N-acetylglucosamine 1-carboxyvinyltransferase
MRIRIEGRQPLQGTYTPSGSSNSAQALTAAALMAEAPVTLHNYPVTSSTTSMLHQAEAMGVSVSQAENTVTIHAGQITRRTIEQGENEASVGALLFLAPMLLRRGYARLELDYPLNRIRTHLEALRDLGQDILASSGAVDIKAAPWEKRDIVLTQTSVTATAIVMMLAARMGRETVIHNAASEPHVQALGHLLAGMGAHIEGIGSSVLTVHGVEALSGAEARIEADHIEAASIAGICALTGGRMQIGGIASRAMRLIAKIFLRVGVQLELEDDAIYVPRHDILTVSNREEDVDASIETAPWPGFPSDLVALATVIATQARGTSLIHEKLFSNRLLFVDKLKAMGAQIVLADPHRAIVMGASRLRGIYMDSPDVRTGLGMVAAALCAERETVIDNAQALNHTFGDVISKLQAVGARIQVEQPA